ncbi:MAG: hypothetical protein OXI46_07225 [Gemmatimonadota bacterium]|nr:hypothetical protein [Gemmatimonadota bacterium]
MSRWKQWARPPGGALPGGIVTKAGIALMGVLVAGLLFSWSVAGPEEAAVGAAPPEPQAVDEGMGRALEGRIRAETERQTQQAAATEAREEFARLQDAAEEAALADAESEASGAVVTGEAEAELREALRLEEIERRMRSLRSQPVVSSYRSPSEARNGGALPSGDSGEPEFFEDALEGTLTSLERSLAAFENEIEAGLATTGLPPGTMEALPSGMRSPASGTPEPGRMVRPDDPPGWERVHEGSFLEAVLLTQLSGDFPGPVLAMVSVPLYSADRQRVLIPRGARVVGTAQAVEDRDQSGLAVAFHRLLLPGGSWIDLEFRGLNQAGESALKDEVDRHYVSMFAAAGAVGVLSGFTLAGAPAYGLQAGVGQGLGQSATSVLGRFLNRMPTLTVRAGHRLRIWLTSDVLVPTSATSR